MQEEKQQPYFYNPGMSAEQLEDWLNQQHLHVVCFNRLVKEKATLEGQLEEINKSIEALSTSGFEGKQRFPWDPSPLPSHLQTEKQPKEA